MILDKEILKRPELSLPIFYEEGNCKDELNNRIQAFCKLLKSCEEIEDSSIDIIQHFSNHVSAMFDEYYLGHLENAYKEFNSAIAYIYRDAPVLLTDVPDESLFRARINENDRDYKNNEMFHIKYSDRGKVSTQRFSFPGLPCLYLGASSYVCWLELNRPSFDKFQVALITHINGNEKKEKVLDLAIHPHTFYNELERRENGTKTEHENISLEKYLHYWPLIAACSMAVKNEKDVFKPEYIFPQFLLQMIIEGMNEEFQDVHGIRYMSIKAGRISLKQYESDYRTYTNYVFPIRSEKPNEDGFCRELSESFVVSRNYSGRELQILTDMIREKGIEWNKFPDNHADFDDARIYGSNDYGYKYKNSIFKRIEKILENACFEDDDVIIDPISNYEIDKLFK